MPRLDNHQSNETMKILLMGDAGGGKTGALASLAMAGYNLYIHDFDNGLDILAKVLPPEAKKRVFFQTFSEEMKALPGGRFIPKKVEAYANHVRSLDKWPDDGSPLSGKSVYSLGPDSVFVLDSLTFHGRFALNHILGLNGRIGQSPYQSDWGEAMKLQEDLLGMLCGDSMKCHVIVISHIAMIGGEDGVPLRGFPSALGQKLPPRVPRYFNNIFLVREVGAGTSVKRVIRTTPDTVIGTRTALSLPPTLPIETGLATIFEQGVGPRQ